MLGAAVGRAVGADVGAGVGATDGMNEGMGVGGIQHGAGPGGRSQLVLTGNVSGVHLGLLDSGLVQS